MTNRFFDSLYKTAGPMDLVRGAGQYAGDALAAVKGGAQAVGSGVQHAGQLALDGAQNYGNTVLGRDYRRTAAGNKSGIFDDETKREALKEMLMAQGITGAGIAGGVGLGYGAHALADQEDEEQLAYQQIMGRFEKTAGPMDFLRGAGQYAGDGLAAVKSGGANAYASARNMGQNAYNAVKGGAQQAGAGIQNAYGSARDSLGTGYVNRVLGKELDEARSMASDTVQGQALVNDARKQMRMAQGLTGAGVAGGAGLGYGAHALATRGGEQEEEQLAFEELMYRLEKTAAPMDHIRDAGGYAGDALAAIKAGGADTYVTARNYGKDAYNSAKSGVQQAYNRIRGGAQQAGEGVEDVVSGGAQETGSRLQNALGSARNMGQNAFGSARNMGQNAYNSVKGGAQRAGAGIQNTYGSARDSLGPGYVNRVLGRELDEARSMASNTVQGQALVNDARNQMRMAQGLTGAGVVGGAGLGYGAHALATRGGEEEEQLAFEELMGRLEKTAAPVGGLLNKAKQGLSNAKYKTQMGYRDLTNKNVTATGQNMQRIWEDPKNHQLTKDEFEKKLMGLKGANEAAIRRQGTARRNAGLAGGAGVAGAGLGVAGYSALKNDDDEKTASQYDVVNGLYKEAASAIINETLPPVKQHVDPINRITFSR